MLGRRSTASMERSARPAASAAALTVSDVIARCVRPLRGLDPGLQAGLQAAFEDDGVVAHLAQPACHHRRTDPFCIEQHQPRAAHADVLVGGLHQLAARRVLRAGEGLRGEFFGRAHVAQEGGAHGVGAARRTVCAPVTCGTLKRVASALRGAARGVEIARRGVVRISGRAAVFEREVVQIPALRAVFERVDRIG